MNIQEVIEWREERERERAAKRAPSEAVLAQTEGLTPEQRLEAEQALQNGDPSVLKQHAENLFGRLAGRKPQPVVQPGSAQSNTGKFKGIVAQGQTPEQAALGTYKAQLEAQYGADNSNVKNVLAQVQKIQADPNLSEDQKRQQLEIFGVRNYRPTSSELERQDYQSALQGGYQGSFEQFKAEQTARGRAAGTPEKPGIPRQGTVNGKPAWAVLTARGWEDPVTHKPIQGFVPPPSYAEVAIPLADARAKASAKYGLQAVTDADGNPVLVPKLDALDAAKSGEPYSTAAVGTPTGTDKNRQVLAESGIFQIGTMRDIIKRKAALFGPGEGRAQELAAWIGSPDPDVQKFRAAALFLAEHSTGVFGGRSVRTVKELQDTITSQHLTPAALLAGLDQDEKTLQQMKTAGGRLAPRRKQKSGRPPNAAGTVKYQGKTYWADADGNNLGEKK